MKATLEYKLDKSLLAVAVLVRELINVTIMYLILNRFVRIKGWEMNELFFLYSFLFLSYSICVFFSTGIRDFDMLVRNGDFDRFLLRPFGLISQIIVHNVDYPAFIGHGSIGVILFFRTANAVGIQWNLHNIIYCILALAGGTLIQISLMIIASSFSFLTINATNLRNLIFFNSRRFVGYPISFYPALIQKFLIFIIPFAFVNYFPAVFLLDKQEELVYGGFFYLTPVVGLIFLGLSICFWKYGLKKYVSTGS